MSAHPNQLRRLIKERCLVLAQCSRIHCLRFCKVAGIICKQGG